MLRVRLSLSEPALAEYVTRQLNHLYDDGQAIPSDTVRELLPNVLRRVEHCFTRVQNKYFFDGTGAVFNHLHGDQYAMFLYLLSNTAWQAGADRLATKAFLLNKALHSVDAYFDVELPSIFLFVHPLATVLGRGRYSDYFAVYQRCGIGSNHDVYPELGEYVTLHPGSAVLGGSRIGRGCTIATESLVLDRDLPENSLYIGNPRDHVLRAADAKLPLWRIS